LWLVGALELHLFLCPLVSDALWVLLFYLGLGFSLSLSLFLLFSSCWVFCFMKFVSVSSLYTLSQGRGRRWVHNIWESRKVMFSILQSDYPWCLTNTPIWLHIVWPLTQRRNSHYELLMVMIQICAKHSTPITTPIG
jgi:hypothetical protein